jgi:hypothetical protein
MGGAARDAHDELQSIGNKALGLAKGTTHKGRSCEGRHGRSGERARRGFLRNAANGQTPALKRPLNRMKKMIRRPHHTERRRGFDVIRKLLACLSVIAGRVRDMAVQSGAGDLGVHR